MAGQRNELKFNPAPRPASAKENAPRATAEEMANIMEAGKDDGFARPIVGADKPARVIPQKVDPDAATLSPLFRVGIALPKPLYAKLRSDCVERGITISDLFLEALEKLGHDVDWNAVRAHGRPKRGAK